MTSMPASRRPRAMTLAPRSCPSKPGLATSTRMGVAVVELLTTWEYIAKGRGKREKARGKLKEKQKLAHGWLKPSIAIRNSFFALICAGQRPAPASVFALRANRGKQCQPIPANRFLPTANCYVQLASV